MITLLAVGPENDKTVAFTPSYVSVPATPYVSPSGPRIDAIAAAVLVGSTQNWNPNPLALPGTNASCPAWYSILPVLRAEYATVTDPGETVSASRIQVPVTALFWIEVPKAVV